MKRVGFFDAAGKCLAIHSGAGEPPPIDYAYSADVPHGLGPGFVEFNSELGKVHKIEPAYLKHPVEKSPSLLDVIAQLERRIERLEQR